MFKGFLYLDLDQLDRGVERALRETDCIFEQQIHNTHTMYN